MREYFLDALAVLGGVYTIWQRNFLTQLDMNFLKASPVYAKVGRFVIHSPKLDRKLYVASGILMIAIGLAGFVHTFLKYR